MDNNKRELHCLCVLCVGVYLIQKWVYTFTPHHELRLYLDWLLHYVWADLIS